jgi:ankyrin repeat protein
MPKKRGKKQPKANPSKTLTEINTGVEETSEEDRVERLGPQQAAYQRPQFQTSADVYMYARTRDGVDDRALDRAQLAEEIISDACCSEIQDNDFNDLLECFQEGIRFSPVASSEALCVAVQNRKMDVLRFLVNELGGNVNAANHRMGPGGLARIGPDRMTPLLLAAGLGFVDVVLCLVKELGADVDLAVFDGRTPLHIAVETGYTSVVRCLCKDLGANPDLATKRYGATPLFLAAQFGRLDVVIYLAKELGADLTKRTIDDHTPASIAMTRGYWDVVQCLEEALKGKEISVIATLSLSSSSSSSFQSPPAQQVGHPEQPLQPIVTPAEVSAEQALAGEEKTTAECFDGAKNPTLNNHEALDAEFQSKEEQEFFAEQQFEKEEEEDIAVNLAAIAALEEAGARAQHVTATLRPGASEGQSVGVVDPAVHQQIMPITKRGRRRERKRAAAIKQHLEEDATNKRTLEVRAEQERTLELECKYELEKQCAQATGVAQTIMHAPSQPVEAPPQPQSAGIVWMTDVQRRIEGGIAPSAGVTVVDGPAAPRAKSRLELETHIEQYIQSALLVDDKLKSALEREKVLQASLEVSEKRESDLRLQLEHFNKSPGSKGALERETAAYEQMIVSVEIKNEALERETALQLELGRTEQSERKLRLQVEHLSKSPGQQAFDAGEAMEREVAAFKREKALQASLKFSEGRLESTRLRVEQLSMPPGKEELVKREKAALARERALWYDLKSTKHSERVLLAQLEKQDYDLSSAISKEQKLSLSRENEKEKVLRTQLEQLEAQNKENQREWHEERATERQQQQEIWMEREELITTLKKEWVEEREHLHDVVEELQRDLLTARWACRLDSIIERMPMLEDEELKGLTEVLSHNNCTTIIQVLTRYHYTIIAHFLH